MLTIEVVTAESFDESTNEFVPKDVVVLEMEHSLVSLSKWESEFEVPFLSSKDKTPEQMLWYIEAMTLTPNIPPEVFRRINQENIDSINYYINRKMTATWFNSAPNQSPSREIITAELIYYWMFSMAIPKECENWHIRKLLTLIKVFNHKNAQPKKQNPKEAAKQRHALNEQRKAKLGTRG